MDGQGGEHRLRSDAFLVRVSPNEEIIVKKIVQTLSITALFVLIILFSSNAIAKCSGYNIIVKTKKGASKQINDMCFLGKNTNYLELHEDEYDKEDYSYQKINRINFLDIKRVDGKPWVYLTIDLKDGQKKTGRSEIWAHDVSGNHPTNPDKERAIPVKDIKQIEILTK